jgi:hypothetical protein
MIKHKVVQNERNLFEQGPEKIMCDSVLYAEVYDDVLTLKQNFSEPVNDNK